MGVVNGARPLFIFGAGGHGKVVAEAALAGRQFAVRGFLDDDSSRHGASIMGLAVHGGLEAIAADAGRVAVALGVGSNRKRADLNARLEAANHIVVSVIHPAAVTASGVAIAPGTYVGPLAVLHVDARIGKACIVNSAAVLEHDDVLEDAVHVSPGAVVGGGVTLERGVHVGLGACILPNLTVGPWTVVGAGAVVTSSLPGGIVAVGAPARAIRRAESP